MYDLENNSAYLTLFPQQDTYHLYPALTELVEYGFYCFGFWLGLFAGLDFFPFQRYLSSFHMSVSVYILYQ